HFEIIASILEAARYNSEDRYSLMKRTGFNYAQLKKYLECLTKIDFIEKHIKERRISYKATAKGLDFLGQYYVLLGILLNAYTQNKQPQIICQARKTSFSRSKNLETRSTTRSTRQM
ncbi:MAG: winged helix-turn-helix domain-containing protein, partial [Candidatus Bathyarchaeota archaeon]|nr:winged helix-turn-helix domain-containing protein [Candidatus Bathyarchaeota archaeon]